MTCETKGVAALLLVIVATACARPGDLGPAGPPAPTAVMCADVSHLRQRATDERRQVAETTSDQTKVVAASRATFYMLLASVADLKCRTSSDAADASLSAALAEAQRAESAGTFYEAAVRWAQAGMAASQAVSDLAGQPSASSK